MWALEPCESIDLVTALTEIVFPNGVLALKQHWINVLCLLETLSVLRKLTLETLSSLSTTIVVFLARLLILLKKWAFAIEVRRRRRQLLLVGAIT